MNVYYDCEFREDGVVIDLISIGMVADDGKEFYAVSNEFDTRCVAQHDWLMENVMNSIEHDQFIVSDSEGVPVVRDIYVTDPAAMSRQHIRRGILEFLAQYRSVELWAWFGAYDHVCLAQLWGPMVELPYDIIPMYTNDIKTLAQQAGNPKLPAQPAGVHNALEDAKFNKVRYDFLMEMLNGRK